MEENTKVDYFYMKKFNKIAAIVLVIVGLNLLAASFAFAAGTGAIGCALMACAGVILLYKSRQPLIKLYGDRIDTTTFKALYSDIVKIDKKNSMYTLHFSDGSKNRISTDVFDKEPKARLIEFLDEMKSTRENSKAS